MIKLLIVDDEPTVRRLVSRWGHAAGYAVAEAASVAEALVRIGAAAPAVALCDVLLPDGDGRDLSQLLRQHSPHTALILISGLGEGASPSCLDSGAVGFLAKPFSHTQLLAAIELGIDEHFDRAAAAAWEETEGSAAAGYDGVRGAMPPRP